jgi:type I restriction enzyme S subunit
MNNYKIINKIEIYLKKIRFLISTTHKKFNKTSLRKLKITIPTTVQQSKILDDINKLNNRIRIIEQHTKNNLKNFEFLKQSILQKAFNGELIKVS